MNGSARVLNVLNPTDGRARRGAITHIDGSICVEGTRRVPRGFRACCETFGAHTAACDYDIRYEWWTKPRIWVVKITETAGGGGIRINFCPHCGVRLAGSTPRRKGAGAKQRGR